MIHKYVNKFFSFGVQKFLFVACTFLYFEILWINVFSSASTEKNDLMTFNMIINDDLFFIIFIFSIDFFRNLSCRSSFQFGLKPSRIFGKALNYKINKITSDIHWLLDAKDASSDWIKVFKTNWMTWCRSEFCKACLKTKHETVTTRTISHETRFFWSNLLRSNHNEQNHSLCLIVAKKICDRINKKFKNVKNENDSMSTNQKTKKKKGQKWIKKQKYKAEQNYNKKWKSI